MSRSLLPVLLAAALLLLLAPPAAGQDGDGDSDVLPTIAEKTEGLEKRSGFFPLYWDARTGTVYLEIPRLGEHFLYLQSLPAGLGSNPVGLDRGQLGGEQVVRFERVGPKVLLVAPNLKYRASSENPAERKAVREAFAEGVLYGFEAVAESDGGGRVLVDATEFMVRPGAYDVAKQLQDAGQGTFSLAESRSAPFMENTKAFPQNTELAARLTYTSEDPGAKVRRTAAAPESVTLRVRQSLIALPDSSGFRPRRFDPRSGFFYTSYADYAVPIGTDLEQRFIARHRLKKEDPDAEMSAPAGGPITYYLDRGTPEPVRSALLDGARWWKEAFRAAGFRDAFRVKMMPKGADPMDVRYNVIQWVHRRTRGWSYGASVTDPRTGEIIKGHVTLGSQRVRQDYLLAEGLLAPYTDENAGGFAAQGHDPQGTPEGEDPMLKMALARIRQLAAHETGHTLGLAHNFAASTGETRASVMDYPAPLATVAPGGEISLEDAYDTGIGEWDTQAIRYGYGVPAEGQSTEAFRQSVLAEMQERGLSYLTDADARPGGAAEPSANLWDNGTDMVQALQREMKVRREALGRFGEAVIREGEPLATMEEALVPLYLRHRYQVAATAKLLGGVRYRYALRDASGEDGSAEADAPQPVEVSAQREALGALLQTVTPQALALPEAARRALPPRPPGYAENRELFDGYTGVTFDPYAPAETAAQMTFAQLVAPARMARMAYQTDRRSAAFGLRDVLDEVTAQVWKERPPEDAYRAGLKRTVQQTWTDALLGAAQEKKLAPPVRAALTAHLRGLEAWLAEHPGTGEATQAHRALARRRVARYLDRPYRPDARERQPLGVPPGSPIGTECRR
jgi:hypothetical protein